MYDISLLKLMISVHKLRHVGINFRFCQFPLDVLAEIRVTQFCHDVGIVFGGIDLVEMQDVGERLKLL